MSKDLSKELLVNSTYNSYRIASVENEDLVEYQVEKKESLFAVGDIYLGVVNKLTLGLNAAFVNIGDKRESFLHYLDLGKNFNSQKKFITSMREGNVENLNISQAAILPFINKQGKINEVLTKNQLVLVQVVKESIHNKGIRISGEITLVGNYIILIPFDNHITISRKIRQQKEKKRLLNLIQSIQPKNFGVIIRTAAENQSASKIDQDIKFLVQTWEEGMQKLKTAVPQEKIIGEMQKVSSMLRDILNKPFKQIIVDNVDLYQNLKNYIKTFDINQEKSLKLYTGKIRLFEKFYNIEKQIQTLFGKKVNMKEGGYLIIEPTEAMHVIDVNSGKKNINNHDQEQTALKVNLSAAKEIVRQLRLRDLGGIIVIDFIGLLKPENRQILYKTIKEYLKQDRSKSVVLPLSRFSVMQITRQRVRPEIAVSTNEKCPTCQGSGNIENTLLITDQIEQDLKKHINTVQESNITLFLHPYLYAFYTKGWVSTKLKWFFKYKKWIQLMEDSSLHLTNYYFMNKKGEKITHM